MGEGGEGYRLIRVSGHGGTRVSMGKRKENWGGRGRLGLG